MKLTCVTATFNCINAGNRERLIRCVESVAKLKTEHEHLIYDGASTDGTTELLRELERTTSWLKIVSESDRGLYNALNKGVRDAKGEWFYVLGADDYIEKPDVLDKIILRESNETQVIITTVTTEMPDGTNGPLRFDSIEQLRYFLNGCVCCHQGELMKTSLVRELGNEIGYAGFDERYRISADTDMLLRAHLKAVPIHYIFQQFACFHQGGLADSNREVYQKEDVDCFARALSLNDKQRAFYAQKHYLPISVSFRFASHPDLAVKMAARHMIKLWIMDCLRISLWPIVIARRKWRSRHSKCS